MSKRNLIPCKNCEQPTNFGNAVPEREKLGWCEACYSYWLKNTVVRGDGTRVYKTEPRRYVKPTPFDTTHGYN